ncbi:cell wall protein DAN4-like [Penaeus monodon]|uniref:cell wall protein DAN4-like n=1 Tax=Penaeus monodon TaxID=6687 RepID=UPI0018A788B6|nr:cell wall protein DAN4-like [Penaeus monodon]
MRLSARRCALWWLSALVLHPPLVSAECLVEYNGEEKPCTAECIVPDDPTQMPTCSTHKQGTSQAGSCHAACDSTYCSDACKLRIDELLSGTRAITPTTQVVASATTAQVAGGTTTTVTQMVSDSTTTAQVADSTTTQVVDGTTQTVGGSPTTTQVVDDVTSTTNRVVESTTTTSTRGDGSTRESESRRQLFPPYKHLRAQTVVRVHRYPHRQRVQLKIPTQHGVQQTRLRQLVVHSLCLLYQALFRR